MSDPENFLTRWSRRKREIEQSEAEKLESTSDPGSLQATAAAATTDSAGETAPEDEKFDPASLPPLESITAETDIRAYFARGVPAELARAALRRVWASDPAIRDFVGLAENAWDFNAPETIPGFGPITASDDVAGMMRRLMGEVETATQQLGAEADHVIAPQAAEVPEYLPNRQDAGIDSRSDANAAQVLLPEREQEETLAIHDAEGAAVPLPKAEAEAAESSNKEPIRARGHGGALPK